MAGPRPDPSQRATLSRFRRHLARGSASRCARMFQLFQATAPRTLVWAAKRLGSYRPACCPYKPRASAWSRDSDPALEMASSERAEDRAPVRGRLVLRGLDRARDAAHLASAVDPYLIRARTPPLRAFRRQASSDAQWRRSRRNAVPESASTASVRARRFRSGG